MSKFFIATALCLIISGCAPSRTEIAQAAANQCPSIGINPIAPDYSLKPSYGEISSYYSCMISNTQPTDEKLIGAPGSPARSFFNGKNEANSKLNLRLQYQYVLWQQIANREITPSKAQQTWLEWSTQIDMQEATLATAQRQTAVSASAMHNANQHRPINCTQMQMGGGMSNINCY